MTPNDTQSLTMCCRTRDDNMGAIIIASAGAGRPTRNTTSRERAGAQKEAERGAAVPDGRGHRGHAETQPMVGLGPDFCWTRVKFLETSSSLRPSNFREISGKSVNTGDRQGTAPPSMSRRPTTNPTPKHSAHHPVVVSKHESCADGISKGADLLLPKHELQEVGFPWKFPEISGNFRRSAVGGRRSSPVGGGRSAYLRRRSNFPGNF